MPRRRARRKGFVSAVATVASEVSFSPKKGWFFGAKTPGGPKGPPGLFLGVRVWYALLALLALLPGASRPFAAEPDTLTVPEPPSLASLLWDGSLTLRLSGGYRDNPRLSALNPAGSSFVAGGGEFMLFRLPIDGHEVSLYASIDHLAYLERGFAPETLIALDARYTRTWREVWSAGASVEYLYLKQVFDASEIEGIPLVLPTQGHTFTFRPVVGYDLGPPGKVEVEWEASRQWLSEPLDGFVDQGPRLGWLWSFGRRRSLGVSCRFRDREFDERQPFDQDGKELPTALRYEQHEVEVAWRHAWGEGERWRTVLRPGWVVSHENGGGYFDYDRLQVAGTVRYLGEHWEARIDGRARWYTYPGQAPLNNQGAGERRRIDVGGTLRGDWKVRKGVRVFIQFEFEFSDEDALVADYHANGLGLGVELEM